MSVDKWKAYGQKARNHIEKKSPDKWYHFGTSEKKREDLIKSINYNDPIWDLVDAGNLSVELAIDLLVYGEKSKTSNTSSTKQTSSTTSSIKNDNKYDIAKQIIDNYNKVHSGNAQVAVLKDNSFYILRSKNMSDEDYNRLLKTFNTLMNTDRKLIQEAYKVIRKENPNLEHGAVLTSAVQHPNYTGKKTNNTTLSKPAENSNTTNSTLQLNNVSTTNKKPTPVVEIGKPEIIDVEDNNLTLNTTSTTSNTDSTKPATLETQSINTDTAETPATTPKEYKLDDKGEYKIQEGDTLSVLANKFNLSLKDIAELNNITDVNKIYAGKKLKINPIKKSNIKHINREPMDVPKLSTSLRINPNDIII